MTFSNLTILFRLLGLISGLVISGCASDIQNPIQDSGIKLLISEKNADYIRHVQVELDDEGAALVKGHIRRGVVGHIPHLYQGHIDLAIEDKSGAIIETGMVGLKGKQEHFTYRMTSNPSMVGAINVGYFKMPHSSH